MEISEAKLLTLLIAGPSNLHIFLKPLKLSLISLLYKKYPLHKSHKEYGFREPIYYFTPSIGISEITGLGKSKYISSSLGSKKLFFFKLDQEKKISEYHIEDIKLLLI